MTTQPNQLSEGRVVLLAIAAAIVTANAYYIHPIIARVAETFEVRAAWVGLVPLTGRTHQLRVHCMAMGHPIVGDRLYNSAGHRAERMMLHADRLEFVHPFSNRPLRLLAECEF